ncbi:NAD(P)-binding protein, partial [Piedraia hortae CBS 480.64]
MSHTGKTALITGGCSGLGRAIAEMFLERGANVVVCDVNEATTDDFREKVSEAHPGKTIVLKRDITHQDAIDDMFIRAEGIFKKIDFVINNAGILDKFDPVGDLERDLWDRIIAVNLTAPAMITKAAVNSMLKNNVKGSIVNISSIAAVRGFCAGSIF